MKINKYNLNMIIIASIITIFISIVTTKSFAKYMVTKTILVANIETHDLQNEKEEISLRNIRIK